MNQWKSDTVAVLLYEFFGGFTMSLVIISYVVSPMFDLLWILLSTIILLGITVGHVDIGSEPHF